MNESVLAEQTHAFVRAQRWQAAVLPFGATEPHNLHMPYGTDTFQVEVLGRRACQRAFEAGGPGGGPRAFEGGGRVLLVSNVPFGVNTNHLQVPGARVLSVTPTTLLRLL